MSEMARPLGGPILTRPLKVLLAIGGIAMLLIAYRFWAGIGPVSALSDGYPWGIWIAFDVVTGTALACGGYAMALLVYLLNKGRYHPLVRPAVLTSALGYTMAGVSLVVDTGRPWNFWKVPIFFWEWNFNSALLEVALCIMAYVFVLWIELAPALLERGKTSGWPLLRSVSTKLLRILDRLAIWILALGMLLPSMHQSSLGTLMLLAGHKLDPMWSTPILPLLFLVSVVAMGYAAVIFESALAARFFGREPETKMLSAVSRCMVPVLALYLVLRIGDLAVRGQIGRAFTSGGLSFMLLLELVLFAVPLVMLLRRDRLRDLGYLFRAALLMISAGGLYRFDTFLVAFDPGPGWAYFPSIAEMTITIGFIVFEIAIYVVLVKTFPILSGAAPAHSR